MINEILQFIKKTILSIKLARYDILFPFSGLRSFRSASRIARWFVVADSSPLPERICRFLKDENNIYPSLAVEEIALRPDVVGANFSWTEEREEKVLEGNVLYKTSFAEKDKAFWMRLLKDMIIKDFPVLKEQYNMFEKRLNIQSDMRFYASELERLKEVSAALDYPADYEVDWIRSDKNNLYLTFNHPCRLTSNLTLSEQKNLSGLFAGMLFEQGVFVSFWREVAVNASGVFFSDFDFVYSADENLRRFAQKYAQGKLSPKFLQEYRLVRAAGLLKKYCPDINVFDDWKNVRQKQNSFKIGNNTDDLLNHLTKNGVIIDMRPEVKHTSYEDVAGLLGKKQQRKKIFYGKSSILYWGPLIIAAWLLFWHF